MAKRNPSRSGDTKLICWMVKPREDFYYEDYRTVEAMSAIIESALAGEDGDALRKAGKAPRNSFERNVAVYLEAFRTDTMAKVRIPLLGVEAHVVVDKHVLASIEVHERVEVKTDIELQAPAEHGQDVLPGSEEEDNGPQLSAEDHLSGKWLVPRKLDTFYNVIMSDMYLWQRPPHEFCGRCSEYEVVTARISVLIGALYSSAREADGSDKIVEAAGGRSSAHEEMEGLRHRHRDLERHVTWKAKQREYLKKIELNLAAHQALMQLDYGGFTDSEGKKVSAWSVTVVAGHRKDAEHFDFMFDAANQTSGRPGAKKDGHTGSFFLGELFDPDRAPAGTTAGKSIFSSRFPSVRELIFSGDTGNGYRAYAMLDYLSKFFPTYGYEVKLIPLAPGHAWNRTDARIAHMNTFLNALKKKSRVFGAEEIANAFNLAADPEVSTKRKFLARSYVFFRVVVIEQPDESEDEQGPSNFGTSPHSSAADGEGHLGVRSLLYFDFSVNGEDGTDMHPAGCARVRVNADPDLADNPTFLFSWRKNLWADLCQQCSDKAVSIYATSFTVTSLVIPYCNSHHLLFVQLRPVRLSENGCAKKECCVVQEEKRAAVVAMAALPASFPVGRRQNIPLSAAPVTRVRRGRGRASTKTCSTCTVREVTCTHNISNV